MLYDVMRVCYNTRVSITVAFYNSKIIAMSKFIGYYNGIYSITYFNKRVKIG